MEVGVHHDACSQKSSAELLGGIIGGTSADDFRLYVTPLINSPLAILFFTPDTFPYCKRSSPCQLSLKGSDWTGYSIPILVRKTCK
jgi:hypothetical protein